MLLAHRSYYTYHKNNTLDQKTAMKLNLLFQSLNRDSGWSQDCGSLSEEGLGMALPSELRLGGTYQAVRACGYLVMAGALNSGS